jgi:hypothetical protein
LPRIALDRLVGEDRALNVEHRAADDILRGDELDHAARARLLAGYRLGDHGVGLLDAGGEIAGRK